MAITQVTLQTRFEEWKDITNDIINELGDTAGLTTTIKTSLVAAINELDGLIGNLSALSTTAQGSLVAAINEAIAELGDVTNLNTTATDAVAAINELLTQIGTIGDLSTTNTTNLVLAINSVKSELDAQGIADAAAILTVADDLGDISGLNTDDTTDAVAAINELEGEIGDLSTLNTTAQTSLVAAINEVEAESVTGDKVQYTNGEPNGGRYATDALSSITAATFASTGTFIEYNSATFSEGQKFINNNDNYGGSAGSLGTDISTLVAALGTKGGRTNQRYGFEFYINDITMGANTQDAETYLTIDYHPFMVTNNKMLAPIGGVFTFMAWVKLKTLATPANNGILLGDAAGRVTTYRDGVQAAQQSLLTTANGWVHIKQVVTLDTEFYNFIPAIFANSGDVIQIALPVTANTNRVSGMHVGLVN